MVSIVMPAHNCAAFIKESIESVQAQSYGDWELLVVDDCSTDETARIAQAMAAKDSRIRVFVNKRNSGAAFSRNRMLHNAKGDWVAFLDSDDLWEPEKLTRQIAFMEANGYGFSYTEYEVIDEGGEQLGRCFSGPARITCTGMRRYCWPGCLTVMYDRRKVGLVQIADLKKHNDYAMWLKVVEKADCFLLPEVLGRYRMRESSISHGIGLKAQIEHLYILWRKGERLGMPAAIYRTFINLVFGAYKKLRFVGSVE